MARNHNDVFDWNAPIPSETGDLHKAIRTILELMQEPELRGPRRRRERGTRLVH